MLIGGIVVRVRPGQAQVVANRVLRLQGIEVVTMTETGLALVLTADSVKAQKKRHQDISSWPEVEETLVVFQSNEV